MKKRSIAAVILLPFVTFGIYILYWFVKTKGELNEKGASIPTAWFLIIPFVNIWWIWKYYEGVEHVTNGKVSGVLMFILDLFVTSLIPMAICQDTYNKLSDTPAMPSSPTQPVIGTNTDSSVNISDNAQSVDGAEKSEPEVANVEVSDAPQNPNSEGENTPPLNPAI